jgi:iron complex outermembrane recepter protein
MKSTNLQRGTPASVSKPQRRNELLRLSVLAAAAALQLGANAQTTPTETIVITASGQERRLMDTPYAVGVVDAQTLRAAGAMVNLSEALVRVPGLTVNNRSNYAQDLQISSRGFGARASFGVRGMRLYADGLPASGPDGQGQVSHFDLAGASRIEVLRGPFTALYGASSGGVISLVSTAPTERQFSLDLDHGSDGLRQWRLGMAAPIEGGFSVRAQLSRFNTDGFRPQSSAQRTLGNVRLGYEQGADRVVLVANSVNQPSLDALGLTRAQFDANPEQTTTLALPQDTPGQADRFNSRKNTAQDQVGISWRHRFVAAGPLAESHLAAYGVRRSVTQWQAIPVATQLNATNPTLTERQAGGVIDFDRTTQGLDARLVWRWALDETRSLQVVSGASADSSREDRRGFENFTGAPATRVLGVTGKLRRDETNRVQSRDVYAQAEAELATAWAASLGVRSGSVRYQSADRYTVGSNGDDSGSVSYRYTNPVAAVQWKLSSQLNTYVSLGRGFEAPTLNELAYRPDGGSGFNTDLVPQTSQQWELGAKWRPSFIAPGASVDAAVFNAKSDNEIGVATNRGGRSTFRNVGRTQRQGFELAVNAPLLSSLRAQASMTLLKATYTDGFAVCGALPCLSTTVPVAAGNRIAGTVAKSGYAELAWLPLANFELSGELRAQGSQPVNDVNSDFAGSYTLLALRARWQVALPLGKLDLLARVDNLADKKVAGSVIVNEGNSRFFEPAPGRSYLLSARFSVPF